MKANKAMHERLTFSVRSSPENLATSSRLLLLLFVAIAGCATTTGVPREEPSLRADLESIVREEDPDAEFLTSRGGDLPAPSMSGYDLRVVRVYYATDRLPTGVEDPVGFYEARRSERLQYGLCTVSIPPGHHPAQFESERWIHLEFVPDVNKHVVLLHVSPLERQGWMGSLRDRVGSTNGKSVMVFIHGYRVPFSVAARRTAQLVTDMGFEGVPILYSWPSHGTLESYPGDEGNAAWTAPHLLDFLRDVVRESGAERIHVVAHSMGNRPLVEAASQLARETQRPIFDNLVLTAPDVDADILRRSADALSRTARRVTLYASANDKALLTSRLFHSDQARAGEAGKHLLVLRTVDTVDVSALETGFFALGHSYVASNTLALTDLRKLLVEDKPPALRGLKRLLQAANVFWRYIPDEGRNSSGSVADEP